MRGSSRGKYKRGDEPEGPPGRPRKPKAVTGAAAEYWEELCELLEDMQLLTRADGIMLARYCRLLVEWDTTMELAERFSLTADKLGAAWMDEKAAPILDKARRDVRLLNADLCRIEARFALSPADRSRIGAERSQSKVVERFFGGLGQGRPSATA